MRNGKRKAAAGVAAAGKPRPEVTGVVMLLGAVFFALALGTYRGLGGDGLPQAGNLLGTVGQYAAFLSVQVLGLSVFYYLAWALVVGVIWFTDSRHDVTFGTGVAYVLIGAFLAAFVQLGHADRVFLGGHAPGGAVGELLGGLLGSLFSVWGGRAVSLGLIVLLMVLATPQALVATVRRAVRGVVWLGRASWRVLGAVVSVKRGASSVAVGGGAGETEGVGKRRRRSAAAEKLMAEAENGPEAERAREPASAQGTAVEEPRPEPKISRRVTVLEGNGKPHEVKVTRGRGGGEAEGPAAAGRPADRAATDIAAALRESRGGDFERVIEAARSAGLFDVAGPSAADGGREGSARASAAMPAVDGAAGPAPAVPAAEPAQAAAAVPATSGVPGTPEAAAATAEAKSAEVKPAEAKPAEAAGESRKAKPPRPPRIRPPADYRPPGLDLLTSPPASAQTISEEVLRDYALRLTQTLADYGIEGTVMEIHPGPVVTTYEFRPAPGTKLSRIAALENDVAMAMAVTKVRIVAPIPGKNAVGFEVPNPVRETVYIKELLADPAFAKRGGALPVAVGKDLTGKSYYSDLAKMPHLLVAGATGTGKSVFINATLLSLLFRQSPEQMKLLLIDPKHVELITYDRIPHLLLPVVSDMRKAALALRWAVGEMERRYHLFADAGARQLSHYNQKVAARKEAALAAEKAGPAAPSLVRIVLKGPDGEMRELVQEDDPPPPLEEPREKLPSIVIVIDELADLMAVAAKEVETAIQRLAQKGRAAGIHLIVATQRPSVDVITGTIKANFPTRVSFKVSSKTDSRTVLDQNGSDQLLGMGDMLVLPPGCSDLLRVQGAFVSDEEIERVVAQIRTQGEPTYDESIVAEEDEDGEEDEEAEGYDEQWEPALELVLRLKQASISKIQRHLKIGYNRSARIVERMEREGLVGPGANPREKEVYADRILARLDEERAGPEPVEDPPEAPAAP